MDTIYINSDDLEVSPPTYAQALTTVLELAGSNQISPEDVAFAEGGGGVDEQFDGVGHDSPGLAGQQVWQEIALETVSAFLRANGEWLNDIPMSGEAEREHERVDRSADPHELVSALKIVWEMAEGAQISCADALSDYALEAARIEQVTSMDLVNDLLYSHWQKLAASPTPYART